MAPPIHNRARATLDPQLDGDTAAMTSFVLPLTVHTGSREVDLAIELDRPAELAAVLPAIVKLAGLPAETELHHGAGPVDPSWILGRPPLLSGCVLSTNPRADLRAVGPVNLSCVAGPDAGGWVALGDGPVEVGRDPDCDLSLDDPELSRRHATVRWSPEGLDITDLRSANGLRIDGQAVHRTSKPSAEAAAAVPPASLVRLGGSVLRIALDTEPSLLLTPDDAGHLAVARPARVAPPFSYRLPDPVGSAPERTHRPIPLLAAVVGALAGGVIAAVTGMWSFLLLAALGPVMMIGSAASDRLSGRRSHRRASAEHANAVADDCAALSVAVAADRNDAWDRYPDAATLARRAARRGVRLWERPSEHPDFLRLSVGVGARPARVARDDPPLTSEVPITVDLTEVRVLGLAGDCRPLLRHLIAQLAALHSPADLHLSIFSDHQDLHRTQDLPHAGSLGLLTDLPTADGASGQVQRLLDGGEGRVTVVILDDAHRWRRVPGMSELLAGAASTAAPRPTDSPARRSGREVLFICASTLAEALPVECGAVALVRAGLVEIAANAATARAEAAGVSQSYLDAIAGDLSGLCDPDSPEAGLPVDVKLSALFGPPGFRGRIASGWAEPSLRAVIGSGHSGPVVVDLEADGPHLLIAGTTGSGKSELLQTLIAALACAAPPDRTAFLLVDYKGGAAFGGLAGLPHTTGMVTDLDAALAARALTSLRAEVRRREQLLSDAGATDLKGLRDRRKGTKDRKGDTERGDGRGELPPSLVIVVDEFAALGAELPEFLHGLVDVAQRGRSLGLHLVLATQRPAGVLSAPMKANVGLRICLRVTDDADSVDVIDIPDAARLPGEVAGRAFLRRERSRTALFQVATVSSAVDGAPRVRLRAQADGCRADGKKALESPSMLDRIVVATNEAAAGRPRPAPPWLPALPTVYEPAVDGHHSDVLGLVDRPSEQRQPLMRLPAGSVLVLGTPGSGRTGALRRIAWAQAARGAQLLIVDPGHGLADLSAWGCVCTYLDGRDPLLVARLMHHVQAEMHSRGGRTGPPILLLVDGWDAVSGQLDAIDYGATSDALLELAARGPAADIRVALTGELRLEHHRAADSFTTLLRLGVGTRNATLPGPPGRGRLGADEVQLAQCPSGVAAPSAERIGHTGIVVRPIPPSVSFAELPPATPAAVPIGVGGDDAGVCSIDLAGVAGGVLVAGQRRSGVSNTLSVLATAASSVGIPVVRACLAPTAELEYQGRPAARDVDLRGGFEPLQKLLTLHEGPLLLIADQVDCWPETGEALLAQFLAVAGVGQQLAVGARLDRALRCHRGPIAELAALRTGVLLQADSTDGALLDTVLPRRHGRPTAGRGHLVVQGNATPVQIANL